MGFNCAEHKWQHLLNPCPICSYKYSADDIASETNQNDTQDEAERLGLEYQRDESREKRGPANSFSEGYRAGVAARDEQLLDSRVLRDGLQNQIIAHRKEIAALREEKSRLKKHLDMALASGLDASEQLAAEKQKALKLVEATKFAVKFMEAHKYHDFDESEPEFQMMASLESALDDYSTEEET